MKILGREVTWRPKRGSFWDGLGESWVDHLFIAGLALAGLFMAFALVLELILGPPPPGTPAGGLPVFTYVPIRVGK